MNKVFLPGTYRCRVTCQAFTKAKTGTDQFELQFEPLGQYDPQTGELVACADDMRTIYKSISEKTVAGFFEDLRQLFGYEHGTFTRLMSEVEGHYNLIGMEFDAKLSYEVWQGKERERWNWDARRSGTPNQRITQEDAKRLDMLFGVARPAVKPPAAKSRRKPAAPANQEGPEFHKAPEADSSIPF
jgi:hypothetical protein